MKIERDTLLKRFEDLLGLISDFVSYHRELEIKEDVMVAMA